MGCHGTHIWVPTDLSLSLAGLLTLALTGEGTQEPPGPSHVPFCRSPGSYLVAIREAFTCTQQFPEFSSDIITVGTPCFFFPAAPRKVQCQQHRVYHVSLHSQKGETIEKNFRGR